MFLFGIFAFVVLVRWVLGTSQIIRLLKEISDKLNPKGTPVLDKINQRPAQCDFCSQSFPKSELVESISGEMVCPACLEMGIKIKLKPCKNKHL